MPNKIEIIELHNAKVRLEYLNNGKIMTTAYYKYDVCTFAASSKEEALKRIN